MSDNLNKNEFLEENEELVNIDTEIETDSEDYIPEGMMQVEGKRKKRVISQKSKKVESAEHNIKIALNQIVRDAGRAGIPIFTVFYTEEEGYVFNGILPEEIGTDNLKSEYGKFDEFLKTCIGFNKEDELKPVKIYKE